MISRGKNNLATRGEGRKRSADFIAVNPAKPTAEPLVRPACVANAKAVELDYEPFPVKQLLRIARQSGIAEPLACASSLTLLKTSRAIHHSLLRVLKPLGLSEYRFAALVTLYTLEPVPASSADLAYHTEITRPAMTGLLDTMEERGWIRRRHRLRKDRRFSRISLTAKGREVTGFAIYRFLKSAAEISEELNPAQHALFDEMCALLRHRSLNLEA
jgi:DNA-binding MarR family transcriptional regulator